MSVSLIEPPQQPEPVVHVMVWESSPADLRGVAGFGPVASSLPPQELTAWWMALRGLLDAPPADGVDGAVEGLLFVQLRVGTYRYAVIARTLPVYDDLGRRGGSRAQVLIGPVAGVNVPGLDCPTALGLAALDWTDWHRVAAGSRDQLLPLSLDAIRGRGKEGLALLRHHRRINPHDTAALLLRILVSCGTAPVVGRATATTVAEICAAWDIVGQAIAAPWTFTSRAATAAGLDAWLGFVLETPPTVPFSEDDKTWLMPFLQRLAERYADDGRQAVVSFRPPRVLQAHADALAWARSLSLAPGVLRDDAALLEAVCTGKTGAAELSYLERPGAYERLVALLDDLESDRLATLVRTWSVSPARTPARPASRIAALLQARILDQAMTRVRTGVPGDELLDAVRFLARHHPDDVTRALRNAFDADFRMLEPGRRRLVRGRFRRRRQDDQGWKDWQRLAWRAEEIHWILPDAGRQAFGRMPSFALLQHVLSGARHAAELASADTGGGRDRPDEAIGRRPDDSVRLAWELLKARRPGRADRASIRTLLAAPGWLGRLPDVASVLVRTGGGRTASRAALRYEAYRELLAADAVRSVLVGRRGLLWPESGCAPSSSLEDTLLFAMYSQDVNTFTRRHRAWLLDTLARHYRNHALNR